MRSKNLNLSSGQPPENLLGYEIIHNATKSLFSKERALGNSSPPLAYGDNYEYFSKRIASLLETECDRQNVNHELIVPVAGVSNGLDLLCTMFCRDLTKKGIAFVEDSTYYLSISLFEDHGLLVLSLPTDHDGILIEEFRDILENLKEDEDKLPLLLYCIPTFHNPTGRTMSPTRRIQLLDLTQEYSINVVADEVYQFLGFTDYLPENLITTPKPISQETMRSHYPSFASLSPTYSHVMSISSFSKILGPGLRVGWIEFSSYHLKHMFESLGVIKSGSSICHFASYVAVTSILSPEDLFQEQNHDANPTSPLQYSEFFRDICSFRSHLHALRSTLAMKYSALISSLQRYRLEYLSPYGSSAEFLIEGHPSGASSDPSFSVVGGYFIWLYLPEWIGDLDIHESDRKTHMTSRRLLEISNSEPYFLNFMLGATCQKHDGSQGHGRIKRKRDAIRMCFAKLEIHELEEGAMRFCELLRDLQP
jgi:DNA-binding transcriptional MocR family regulator